VFITAYDQYAIEAFENEAIDYMLKPIAERLEKTGPAYLQWIRVQQGESLIRKHIKELADSSWYHCKC
jgi:two-component system LytT family response regulator